MLQEHDGKNWETEEELLPSGHQAPKLKLGLITFTGFNLINCKTFIILHLPHCCYLYIPGTTCLHITLAHPCLYYYLLSPQYTLLHILFYCTFYSFFLFLFYLYLYILSCVVLHILHCPLSGPDLIYISLLIIFCIIEYVMNKKTLNLAEVQTEHQNGEERGFKWLWMWNGCWCQTSWSEYFKNHWSTGIFMHNNL